VTNQIETFNFFSPFIFPNDSDPVRAWSLTGNALQKIRAVKINAKTAIFTKIQIFGKNFLVVMPKWIVEKAIFFELKKF